MTAAAARRLIADLGDDVVEVDVEGWRGVMLAADAATAASSDPVSAGALEPTVRLLPPFDQYVVAATRHSQHLMPGLHSARVYRPQGWLSPVVAVDGMLAGVWRHERRGTGLAVQIEPFAPLKRAAKAAAANEADRLAQFLGGTLELTWAPPG